MTAAAWEAKSPAELLNELVVLTPGQVAYVAGLVHQRGKDKGRPDRRAALELIRSGALPLVDPSQSITRWTVPATAVRKYLGAAA